MGEIHRTSTASLHVPEPQADLGSRSIRNPPLMHEGMRGNNVGMYEHSGAIRSARGYYHSFFSMHSNYWHYCRAFKINKTRPNINGTRQRFWMDPTRTLEPRSLHRLTAGSIRSACLAKRLVRWMAAPQSRANQDLLLEIAKWSGSSTPDRYLLHTPPPLPLMHCVALRCFCLSRSKQPRQ